LKSLQQSVLITGVSTGIGRSTAELLCQKGYHVIGSVRKIEDASALQAQFADSFTPVVFDVANEKDVFSCADELMNRISTPLVGVVNNAGIALGGPILHLDVSTFRKQFEINVMGVLSVTKAFMPWLQRSRKAGHRTRIINISSVSGKRTYPFMGPYSASKHALEAISDALRKELMLYDIGVVIIEPGPINTPIWDKAPDPQKNIFIGSDYEHSLRRFNKLIIQKGKAGFPPIDVAKLILKALEAKRPKTRYVITPNRLIHFTLPGLLPEKWVDRLTAKALHLFPAIKNKI